MKNFLKKAFSTASLGVGTGGALYSGIGVILGGWKSDVSMGGVDLTNVGIALTAIFGAMAYGGYKGLKNALREELNQGTPPPTSPPNSDGPA